MTALEHKSHHLADTDLIDKPAGRLRAVINDAHYISITGVFVCRDGIWEPYCTDEAWDTSPAFQELRRQQRIAEVQAELERIADLRQELERLAEPIPGFAPPATPKRARKQHTQALPTIELAPCPHCGITKFRNKRARSLHVGKCPNNPERVLHDQAVRSQAVAEPDAPVADVDATAPAPEGANPK